MVWWSWKHSSFQLCQHFHRISTPSPCDHLRSRPPSIHDKLRCWRSADSLPWFPGYGRALPQGKRHRKRGHLETHPIFGPKSHDQMESLWALRHCRKDHAKVLDKFATSIHLKNIFWNYTEKIYATFHQKNNRTMEQLDIWKAVP